MTFQRLPRAGCGLGHGTEHAHQWAPPLIIERQAPRQVSPTTGSRIDRLALMGRKCRVNIEYPAIRRHLKAVQRLSAQHQPLRQTCTQILVIHNSP